MWRIFPTNIELNIDHYEFQDADSLKDMYEYGKQIQEVIDFLIEKQPSTKEELSMNYAYLKQKLRRLELCIQAKSKKEHDFDDAKSAFSNVLRSLMSYGDRNKLWQEFFQK